MKNKEHLSEKGFYHILSIKGGMRKGLTGALAESFPNIKPVLSLNLKNPLLKH